MWVAIQILGSRSRGGVRNVGVNMGHACMCGTLFLPSFLLLRNKVWGERTNEQENGTGSSK